MTADMIVFPVAVDNVADVVVAAAAADVDDDY